MDAKELFTQDGKPVAIWYCGKCKFIFTAFGDAERCCTQSICEICGELIEGSEKMRYPSRIHSRCAAQRRLDTTPEISLEEATDILVTGDDTFHYGGMEEILDRYDGDEDKPLWAYPVIVVPFPAIDAQDLYRHIEEERNVEDDCIPEDLKGVNELEAAVAAFNEANKDLVTYTPNMGKKVRIPWETVEGQSEY